MISVTTETIPNKEIKEVLGIARGTMINSKHLGKDIGAGLKSIVGGELKGYSEMLTEAREIALKRMEEDARAKGANAVVGVRLTSSAVAPNVAEMMAYGTAVVI
ncbi:MAG: hypothetical protein ATN36_04330 [Epulopiscium sp. Nele67-Bin005]|nr:MAG: hypothetical protein ATN36_04330 [Epulopiscium sp. Nele67-Bin005]